MRPTHHLNAFTTASTLWLLFFLGGLWSDYYQTWSWPLQLIIIDVLPAIVLLAILKYRITSAEKSKRLRVSLWLAFYFSFPFLVYDFVYLHLYLRESAAYLLRYWYLSFFFIVPWLLPLHQVVNIKNKGTM